MRTREQDYFANLADGDGDVAREPRLPDSFVPHEVTSMQHGEVVYMSAACLTVDNCGCIYMDTDSVYYRGEVIVIEDRDTHEVLGPVTFGAPARDEVDNQAHISVMRITPDAGNGIDGYIVDIRQLMPGDIEPIDDDMKEEFDGSYVPILGIIYNDETGKPAYDSRLCQATAQFAMDLARLDDKLFAEVEKAIAEDKAGN